MSFDSSAQSVAAADNQEAEEWYTIMLSPSATSRLGLHGASIPACRCLSRTSSIELPVVGLRAIRCSTSADQRPFKHPTAPVSEFAGQDGGGWQASGGDEANPNGKKLSALPDAPGGKTALKLTAAILLAAERLDEDCESKDGLAGYFRRTANQDVKAFANFLAKTPPLQVSSAPKSSLQAVVATGIDRVPDEGDRYLKGVSDDSSEERDRS